MFILSACDYFYVTKFEKNVLNENCTIRNI